MKYSGKDLNKLAEEAKQNLVSNANKEAKNKKDVDEIKADKVPEQHPTSQGEDLYSEFRGDENIPADENAYTDHIQTTPTEQDYQNYEIRTNPTEEELEDTNVLEEYEEPIYEGGPSQGQVLMWKKQWGGYDIFAAEITDKTFIFRTMNRFEYKQLIGLKDVDATRREEIICETCTLWPIGYNWRTMATDKAGIPSTYSKIIMQKSGFTQEYSIQIL